MRRLLIASVAASVVGFVGIVRADDRKDREDKFDFSTAKEWRYVRVEHIDPVNKTVRVTGWTVKPESRYEAYSYYRKDGTLFERKVVERSEKPVFVGERTTITYRYDDKFVTRHEWTPAGEVVVDKPWSHRVGRWNDLKVGQVVVLGGDPDGERYHARSVIILHDKEPLDEDRDGKRRDRDDKRRE